jgi:predicted RNase H-like HicB family nuclease
MASKAKRPRYTVVIQWSDEDQCYIASLPEWGPYCSAYGASYEEAAKNAQEVLELLMDRQPTEPPVPAPKLFHYPGADVVKLKGTAVGAKRTGRQDGKRKSA